MIKTLACILFILAVVGASTQPVYAGGDPGAGAGLFGSQCKGCHSAAPGAPKGVGPDLVDVFGAKAASKPGYTYSTALKGAGITWDQDVLDKFLAKPNALVPGTKMIVPGVAAPASRAAIIAYLATLKTSKP